MEHIFYVSPLGSDAADGSLDAPFKTLKRAKKAVISCPLEDEVCVYLRGGEYTEPMRFDTPDSGVGRQILYSAYNGERVIFGGSVTIGRERISRVTDKTLLDRIIDERARENLYAVDLSDHKGDLYRLMMHRTKNYIPTGIFKNGKMMNPSRYPKRDKEWAASWETYAYTEKFMYEGSDTKRPVDIYIGENERKRMELWSEDVTDNLWLAGYFTENWYDETKRVVSIDRARGVLTTDSDGFKYRLKNNEESHRHYFFYNIFEELSEDEDFYIDYDNGIVYMCIFDFDNLDLRLAVQDEPLLQISAVSNITVRGIEFGYTHGVIAQIDNSSSVKIEDCKLICTMYRAATVTNSTNITFDTCDIYELGHEGIFYSNCGEKHTLKLSHNKVVNCEIHDFAKIVACYVPAVKSDWGTPDVKVSYCTIYNSPHNLIQMNRPIFFEIDHCHLYNAVMDTDDASGIYWGRSPITVGNTIHDCYIHDIRYKKATWGTNAIYQDDDGTGADIYNNIFVNNASPLDAFVIKGREYHHTHNCIFIGENPPEGGQPFGSNIWALWCAGAYNKSVPHGWGSGKQLNQWNDELLTCGFFNHTWRNALKGTMWEDMYRVLDEEKLAKVMDYRARLDKEGVPVEIQNARLKLFGADVFWSHELCSGEKYEGSLLDCIREKFPKEWDEAQKKAEGLDEVGRADVIYQLILEMYWFDKIRVDYSVTHDANLTIGLDAKFLTDGSYNEKHINNFNNFSMPTDEYDGESIFIDAKNGDYRMTEKGLAYVQSKIEGFRPIDLSEIGAKR